MNQFKNNGITQFNMTLYKKMLFLILLILSSSAYADRSQISDAKEINLQVFASWLTVPTENPAEDTFVPCHTTGQCSYGLVLYYLGSTTDFNRQVVPVTPGMTWKAANASFVRRFGVRGTATWRWTWRPDDWAVCIGAIPTAGNGGLSVNPPLSIYSTACTVIPPANIQCSVDGDANINHGILNSNQLNGHVSQATVQLRCTGAARVVVSVSQPNIDMGSGIKSQVSIISPNINNSITVTQPVNMIIQSRLSSSGVVSGGVFSGSTIVIFNIQ